MNNQTSMSQKLSLTEEVEDSKRRAKAELRLKGNPLKDLLMLPKQEVEHLFRLETWAAILVALRQHRDRALIVMADTKRPHAERDEATGAYNAFSAILELEHQVNAHYKALEG